MDDYTIYYGLTFLAFGISMAAQLFVRSVYSKYDRIGARRNITGMQAARELLDRNGMYDVGIRQVNGFLTDHYDPQPTIRALPCPMFPLPVMNADMRSRMRKATDC